MISPVVAIFGIRQVVNIYVQMPGTMAQQEGREQGHAEFQAECMYVNDVTCHVRK
jgi:hypothetical protein